MKLRMPGRSRAALPAAALVLLALAGCAPAAAPSATPGFDLKAALAKDYPSDAWPADEGGQDGIVHLLRGFDALPADVLAPPADLSGSAALTAANDELAVQVNHDATTAEISRAEKDAVTAAPVRVSEGLGSRLGPLFTAALGQGRLPITAALFDRVTQGIDGTGNAKDHYGYPRPYVRLGFTADGGRILKSSNPSYDDLAANGSYPSGHTYRGYVAGTLLATLLPGFAPQLLARASDYGQSRIVLGFHYPLDVIGGRVAAQATVAHRWADPEFVPLLTAARTELTTVLGADCRKAGAGSDLDSCSGRAYVGSSVAADEYTARLGYGLPEVGASGSAERVPADAAGLLATAFPKLTEAQRVQVLQSTASDSGAPLDLTADGDASWQRIDLLRAMTAQVSVAADGTVSVRG